ncbi:MAG: hypothetical protein BGP06_12165 [Rhizobiales bacterium 65-9]|nr:hypothetical protein [Hyphomicrobiales bacterium]OJY34014.1 MAG: hypothetical protein BGP06_12165 [Rhizobiales bacterium 65-9]
MTFKCSRFWITTAVAASIAASGLTATGASAFPARPTGLNDAAPSLTENVRAKRRAVPARRGGDAAAAAAAIGAFGALAGAAIAASRRDRYYDGYYDRRAYGPGYGYYRDPPPRAYYGPGPGYHRGYEHAYPQPGPVYGGGRWGRPPRPAEPQGEVHYGSGR